MRRRLYGHLRGLYLASTQPLRQFERICLAAPTGDTSREGGLREEGRHVMYRPGQEQQRRREAPMKCKKGGPNILMGCLSGGTMTVNGRLPYNLLCAVDEANES